MKKFIYISIAILALAALVTFLWPFIFPATPLPRMEFIALQKVVEDSPSSIEKILYSPALPLMEVHMKDGERFMVDSPMNIDYRMELLQKGIHVEYLPPNPWEEWGRTLLMIITNILPILLFFAVLMYAVKKQEDMTKLKIESKNPDNLPYRMTDVAGVDHAKEDLEEIITFLKSPEKFSDLGAKMPKGVLLYGPPGTGKTLLAKAIAGEAGVSFVALSGSSFVEKYVGVGASRIRELFNKAREEAPCIVFIDEIDALGGERGKKNSSVEHDHALNQLLVEMDGFSEQTGIVVIAATNRIDTLDKALLRPGRFDRLINVGLPDVEARLQILKVHARKRKLSEEVDLESWAKRTTFFSGAELESLINEAAIRAVKNNHEMIMPSDMEEAYNRIVAGGEKHGVRHERDTEVAAWHEAGHAILGHIFGRKITKVTIVPTNNGAGGYTLIENEEKMQTYEELLQELKILMGGRVAEEIAFGREKITGGASADLKKATQIASTMVASYGMGGNLISIEGWTLEKELEGLQEKVEKLLTEAYEEAKKILLKERKNLERLADALKTKETLVDEELDHYLIRPILKAS